MNYKLDMRGVSVTTYNRIVASCLAKGKDWRNTEGIHDFLFVNDTTISGDDDVWLFNFLPREQINAHEFLAQYVPSWMASYNESPPFIIGENVDKLAKGFELPPTHSHEPVRKLGDLTNGGYGVMRLNYKIDMWPYEDSVTEDILNICEARGMDEAGLPIDTRYLYLVGGIVTCGNCASVFSASPETTIDPITFIRKYGDTPTPAAMPDPVGPSMRELINQEVSSAYIHIDLGKAHNQDAFRWAIVVPGGYDVESMRDVVFSQPMINADNRPLSAREQAYADKQPKPVEPEGLPVFPIAAMPE